MRLFLHSAELAHIHWAADAGLIDGVTTSGSLLAEARGSRDRLEHLREISRTVEGPVAAEVVAADGAGMYREGKELARVGESVVVSVPMVEDGLVAARRLVAEGITVNVTLIFSPIQALLAAKAGAAYVSPSVGRLDDIGHPGMDLIGKTRTIFRTYEIEAAILASSLRHPRHVLEAALVGADIAAMSAVVLRQLLLHPLTDLGMDHLASERGGSA